MVKQFPIDKLKTPDDFQEEYRARYRNEARHALPWVIGIPLVLIGGIVGYGLNRGLTVNVVWALISYAVLAFGMWIAIGPAKPARGEGSRTRAILDASRQHGQGK